MRVLIVKTSSLGDVIHCLPALSDAHAALPGARFDWLIEEAFAEIPAWHPAVQRVIPCALRRWRRSPLQALRSGQWRRFGEQLRSDEYDLVLDAQGLVKSAWLAGRARGPRAGPGFGSAREPLAAAFYQRRVGLPRHDRLHAVQRMRLLFAGALGYPQPATLPDFGLARAQFPRAGAARPYCVLLHATTWPSKRWPEARWQEVGAWLRAQGVACVLPWGSDDERAAAGRIATAFGGEVPERMSLTALAGILAHASFALGVDTGLSHLAGALGTPAVTLYGPTLPALTGTVGADQVHLVSGETAQIDRARRTDVAVSRVQAALTRWLPAPAVPAVPTRRTAPPPPAPANPPPPGGTPARR